MKQALSKLVDKIASDPNHVGRTLVICHATAKSRQRRSREQILAKCQVGEILVKFGAGRHHHRVRQRRRRGRGLLTEANLVYTDRGVRVYSHLYLHTWEEIAMTREQAWALLTQYNRSPSTSATPLRWSM